MLEIFVRTFTHPAFTATIAFAAGHFLAIGRDRIKEFNAARDEFRKVFNYALVNLYTNNIVFGADDSIIRNCRVAYLNFRPHLIGEYQNQYDEAWEKLNHDYLNKPSVIFGSPYQSVTKDIEYLLEFTEYKLSQHIKFLLKRYKIII